MLARSPLRQFRHYKIVSSAGDTVAVISAIRARWIPNGIDFQPNLFNGYHAIEVDGVDQPIVLNVPQDLHLVEER